jgi:hypothetical protein
MDKNFVRSVLVEGGTLKPLLLPAAETKGLGLCNPSVFVDNGEIWTTVRCLNYTLYACEGEQKSPTRYGPLAYLHPENDQHLRTTNFLCKLNPDLSIEKHWKIEMPLDIEPHWTFIGLEDARLFRWDGHLYICGCRRDTAEEPEGRSRMELSELEVTDTAVREIGRYRIEHPVDPTVYCEKNWVPILDKPYHFIHWFNPCVPVKVDLKTLSSKRAITVDETDKRDNFGFLRGSSHVIPWGGYYICIVHDVDRLWMNKIEQKEVAIYNHYWMVYDKNFKIVNISEPFHFMDSKIEFCCGMALWENDLLVTFGYSDNAAFILRIPEKMIPSLVGVQPMSKKAKS